MIRKGGKENHLLQLSETRTYHGRMSRFKKQDIFFYQAKEVIYEESSQSHLGLRK